MADQYPTSIFICDFIHIKQVQNGNNDGHIFFGRKWQITQKIIIAYNYFGLLTVKTVNSFDNYISFGGWVKPVVKLFAEWMFYYIMSHDHD